MFSTIPEIIEELRAGRMVVLADAEDRENEGDLVLPADAATPELINFMTRAAGGYMCLSLTEQDCDRLALAPQAGVNTSVRGTAFTVSIDGHPRHGVGTGVSAPDRWKTVQLAIDPRTGPEDFVRPGHINPLRSRDGGVLVRTGQTEGAVDLARLAGRHPSALIIEIVGENGEMMRRGELARFCETNKLKMCSVEQVIEHRLQRERLVARLNPVRGVSVRTEEGEFNLIAFRSMVDPLPHLALTLGGVGTLDASGRVIEDDRPTLVRMHRRQVLGDVFGAITGDGAASGHAVLRSAMRAVQREGRGAIVYLRPEGLGDGMEALLTSIHRDAPGDDGPDLTGPRGVGAAAVPMHLRQFGIGGQILRELGLQRLRLLSNSNHDLPGLDAFGLEIVERVGC